MVNSIIKYAFDRSSGNVIFIDNADNGLGCNCKCAKCNKVMVAVQGEAKKKEWHFRHHEETDCSGGQETAIHKLAKQIIVSNRQIAIPGEVLDYTGAQAEKTFLSVIPDVTVIIDGLNIHFEITVTHGIDSAKRNFYTSGEHKSIEIDLTGISYDITPAELEELILRQVHNKKKIFWEKVVEEKKETPALIKVGFVLLVIYLFKRLFSRK